MIATGRDTAGIVPYVEELALAQGMVPCVSYNGSHGFECTPAEGAAALATPTVPVVTPVFTSGLPPTAAMDIVRFAETIGCTAQW